MFKYVGHPYYDVGIATLAAFVGKKDPQMLTQQDLAQAADYMTREYVQKPMRSYLTVAFQNSGFTQPAFFNQPERQEEYARRVLRSYADDVSLLDEKCVFTGKPAVAVAFDDRGKLPLGRAFRQHIPLLTKEGAINFHPNGDSGIPVSGEAMMAIQALPLGCAKSAGRLLMVHSDNPDLTYHFARAFLEENRRAVQLARLEGSDKMPEPHHKRHTLLIKTLLEAEYMRSTTLQEEESLFTLTAYHLSNGRKPGLDIYFLPMQAVGFLQDMEKAKFATSWHRIVSRAWETDPQGKRKKQSEKGAFEPTRNFLYEDIFGLPANAGKFIRTYLLRTTVHEASLVSWAITERFLRRMLNMDQHQVTRIREMGDRLADYIRETDDKFTLTHFRENRYYVFRTTLLRANSKQLSRGREPLIEFEPYVDVFELAAGDSHKGWRLARDLVYIRIVEQLYRSGWYNSPENQTAIEETTEDQPEEFQEASI